MLENEGRSSPSIIQTQLIVRGAAIAERKCEINEKSNDPGVTPQHGQT